MPLNETTEAELLAYAYGELSAQQARAFEQRLQGDVELRAELASVMATRELFGRDARWGLDSKVDLPPPHLVDAIVRSEALARPPEIRAARAVATRPTLTARLSRWLIGGGVLVGATAAVLFVVTQKNPEAGAPMVASAKSEPSPTADASKADLAAAGAADEDLADKLVAQPMEEAPDMLPPQAPAMVPRPDAKPKPAEPLADGERGRARALETDDRGGIALGLAAGPAGGSVATGSAALNKDAPEPNKDAPEPKSAAAAPEATRRSARTDSVEGKVQASPTSAGDDAFAFDSAAPQPPPPPSPTAPASTPPAPRRANAPATPPDDAPALKERPSKSTLDVITRDELKLERQRLVETRREQAAKRKKPAASREKAGEAVGQVAEQAPAKSSSATGKRDDAKKSADKAPLPEAGPEQKRTTQAEFSLVSGYRELKEGRALDALDEFQSAERLDARRALGSDPHVGQMRALLALKRPAEALAIARRLVTRNVAEGGVADGLLLGAKIAEDVGDLRTARELWTALVKAPAHKSAAMAALGRLANPAVRAPADVDAAAEAEATPAAAAPAAKE